MIKFNNIEMSIEGGKVKINGFPIVEVGLTGENRNSHLGAKQICLSETPTLNYVSHEYKRTTLFVVLRNEKIEVVAEFKEYDGVQGFSVKLKVQNISDKNVRIENISFVYGLGKSVNESDDICFTRFLQSHHAECQPKTKTLFDEGLSPLSPNSQIRVAHGNVGSWSTKEELPLGLLSCKNNYLAFQIESCNNRYYEISDFNGNLYLNLSLGCCEFCGWSKTLKPGEQYETKTISMFFANCLNDVMADLTIYRRQLMHSCEADTNLPVIFNEYMHLSWDSPEENRTKSIAPEIAKLGVKYYVIDCGWHNEEPGDKVYPYVGQWKESKVRFPHGLKTTTDYIRSLGMKPGLWIEPEIIGYKCNEMLQYYDEECFIYRFGEKICVQGRYFLDFRNEKVILYMNETIRRMIEDYGAEYIKIDYNQDIGIGADDVDGFGAGIEKCANAFFDWTDKIRRKFPSVVFEWCASGGMRLDWESLSRFSVASTSDQTDYKKYPYIVGNIFAATLPEQAGVWSYPVASPGSIGVVYEPSEDYIENNISAERVTMNMVNAILGRVHLASRIDLLNGELLRLVKEGVDYYNSLTDIKKKAYPYLPLGFARYGDSVVACGLKYLNKIYLAVWNLKGENKAIIPINEKVISVKVGYPMQLETKYSFNNGKLTVHFNEITARLFEIELLLE